MTGHIQTMHTWARACNTLVHTRTFTHLHTQKSQPFSPGTDRSGSFPTRNPVISLTLTSPGAGPDFPGDEEPAEVRELAAAELASSPGPLTPGHVCTATGSTGVQTAGAHRPDRTSPALPQCAQDPHPGRAPQDRARFICPVGAAEAGAGLGPF